MPSFPQARDLGIGGSDVHRQDYQRLYQAYGVPFGGPGDLIAFADRLEHDKGLSISFWALTRRLATDGGLSTEELLVNIASSLVGQETPLLERSGHDFLDQLGSEIQVRIFHNASEESGTGASGTPFSEERLAASADREGYEEEHAGFVASGAFDSNRERAGVYDEPLLSPVSEAIPDDVESFAPTSAHEEVADGDSGIELAKGKHVRLPRTLLISLAVLLCVGVALKIGLRGHSSAKDAAGLSAIAPSAASTGASTIANSPVLPAPVPDPDPHKPTPFVVSSHFGPPQGSSAPASRPASAGTPYSGSASASLPPGTSPSAHAPATTAPVPQEDSAVPLDSASVPSASPSSGMSRRTNGRAKTTTYAVKSGWVTVSSGVMAANLTHMMPPGYPTVARLSHLEGAVVLQAVISPAGRVEHVHVLTGHYLLRGAASKAVSQWRYRPYFVNGVPVEVATIVTVNFQLHRIP